MKGEPPDEIKRRLPHEPALWARNYLSHPNDPTRTYDFYTDGGEDFLYYLVDDDGPMDPSNWGDINVLLFARGCLKTWTTTSIAGWAVDTYPAIEGVATAPVDDQRYEVIDRFKEKIEQAGMKPRREKNKLSHQKFRNTVVKDGEKTTSYSHLKSRSAWSDGDKLRGLHAHFGIIDESQDVDEGTFSTFLEAIDRQVPQVDYFPTIFVIGTPKMANTFFHKLWRFSDQKSWDDEEREWVVQGESDEFLPEELKARKSELEDKIERLEDAEDPNEDLIQTFRDEYDELEGFTVRGWHIDQHNSPLHSVKDVAFKRETYSKRKFKNEVEAEFFSPDNDLITSDNVWAALDAGEELTEVEHRRFDDSRCVLGVDWGGGSGEGAAKTVCVVAELHPEDERLFVNKVHIMDPDLSHHQQRDKIDQYMHQYDIDQAVVDEGFGVANREELQDEYGHDDTLVGAWYGNVKDREDIKWNRHESTKRFFTCDKSYNVEKMAEDFKDVNIVLPKESYSFDTKRSKGTQILDHLTAPYTERKEIQSGKTKKNIVSDRNDDVFDALTFAWMAAYRLQSTRTLTEIRSSYRSGYE
jgi:hypothetical protein